jgi:hypothetical protein
VVYAFILSEDGKRFAALGEKHNYVFDCPEELSATLQGSFRHALTASFFGFTVSTQGIVKGGFTLRMDSDKAPIDREAAEAAGFRKLPDVRPTLNLTPG